MQLNRYVALLTNLIDSRRDAELEYFFIDTIEPGQNVLIE